ncbi:(2Fe-2S)-binding protein [Streptomyces hygroscopicus subsp. hygroscopicus]|uniref:NAD(P)H-nitrite reductase large subunit n=1 Tax=Streptomyces demainii TaxID=588122 RepID=A0ABT9L4X5_9ACTN|nr:MULTISPECIES: (2Fe-2S)-binding protein [Streptomyces]MBW8090881.1 (2Fe-2S)-binding protein [Streptomyces hygroscopicus subsp. hygroscopicus]MDN3058661.1 (2Fe-2S)-binding protein [Streptomyces sp. SRF1]MDP9615750.1 NAD(P)H-nitrite reductase large subunit [Streptomyces demainii]
MTTPDGEPLVCVCAKVTEKAVLVAKAAGAGDIPALRAATRASTGCGDCLPDLEELLE